MQRGFAVAKSGSYQLPIQGQGTSPLKNTANVDNLVINARRFCPRGLEMPPKFDTFPAF